MEQGVFFGMGIDRGDGPIATLPGGVVIRFRSGKKQPTAGVDCKHQQYQSDD